MPELPEVETIARSLAPQVEGRRITAVSVLWPKTIQAGADLLPRLEGASIRRVFRRAKLLLISLAAGKVAGAAGEELLLAFHLKMTGGFLVHPRGSAPLKHTRLILDLEGDGAADGGRLFFDDTRKFGWCRVLRPADLAAWPFWTALGPEPLEMSSESLARHFQERLARSGRGIKAALLDQSVVAGVGNIYADESLFLAGIAPQRKAREIGGPELLTLATALRDILARAVRECGSSIRDYRDALGNAGAFQNSFAVYGRKGEVCRVCGAPLQAARVAGRGTVYCPRCQK